MTKASPTSTLNSEPDRDDEVVKRFRRVRYWHLADVNPMRKDVRFSGARGHDADMLSRRLVTHNGLGREVYRHDGGPLARHHRVTDPEPARRDEPPGPR